MEQKLVKALQKFFWIAGWFVLATTLMGMGFMLYTSLIRPAAFSPAPTDFKNFFTTLPVLRVIISGVTDAFFAFLMSAVFTMIIHRRAVDNERTRRFLVVTCTGYAIQSVMILISWVHTLVAYKIGCSFDCSLLDKVLNYTLTGTNAMLAFSPVLYGVAIYVLYKHFVALVTFESEVV